MKEIPAEIPVITAIGDELYRALRQKISIEPLTERYPNITIPEALEVSRYLLHQRLADGETVVGKKIGLTSKVVQTMLGVDQPDYGYLTDAMQYASGDEVPVSTLMIQPRAEGELAFILKDDLGGPGVTAEDVINATEGVTACFEIVDSRIRDWKIRIQDTIADNASSGAFVVSEDVVPISQVDLELCGMVVEKNGEIVATGAGAAALGSPANCVAWLANTLSESGESLKSGEIILSGAFVPMVPVSTGDHMFMRLAGVGSAEVNFA